MARLWDKMLIDAQMQRVIFCEKGSSGSVRINALGGPIVRRHIPGCS
jgi:hypothetical protein